MRAAVSHLDTQNRSCDVPLLCWKVTRHSLAFLLMNFGDLTRTSCKYRRGDRLAELDDLCCKSQLSVPRCTSETHSLLYPELKPISLCDQRSLISPAF